MRRLIARCRYLAVGSAAAWLLTVSAAQAQSYVGVPDPIIAITMIVLVFSVYFTPSFVAFFRRHPNRWPIFAINLLFGATGLGWLGSLIWAFGAVHKSEEGSDGGESGLNLFVNDPQTVRIEGAAGGALAGDLTTQLVSLKRLLNEGAISQEEYADLRRPILDRMRAGTA